MRSTIARLKLEVELLGQGPEANETRRRLRSDIAAMEGILERVDAGRLEHKMTHGLSGEPAPIAGRVGEDAAVMVVDDDAVFAQLLARRLQKAGLAAVPFTDVVAAMAAWHPGIEVVLDLSVIQPAGADIEAWIERSRPFLLTGASSTQIIGTLGPIERYLTRMAKPPDVDHLVVALQTRRREG